MLLGDEVCHLEKLLFSLVFGLDVLMEVLVHEGAGFVVANGPFTVYPRVFEGLFGAESVLDRYLHQLLYQVFGVAWDLFPDITANVILATENLVLNYRGSIAREWRHA